MENRILCSIVTYNRYRDLKACLNALTHQSFKGFDILVVNNGSTDGTKEFLDGLSDIICIHQDNLGGAGGFYAGMKYALDNGYEWIWMMDDDGVPDHKQLEELLNVANKGEFQMMNALVVNKETRNQLAFGSKRSLSTLPNDELLTDLFSAFNGTFINRSVLETIGLIKREMFIWGDEQEYLARARKAGYKLVTVRNAIHYHPEEKGKKEYAFPIINKGKVLVKPKKLSKYYYRNLGYINQNYHKLSYHIKAFTYHTIYFIRTFELKELIKFYKFYISGLKNDYSK